MSTATKTRRTQRPKMSAGEATHFERMSVASYAQCVTELEQRRAESYADCKCEPYADLYTFNRWRAQGYHVRKGEKAIRFSTWLPVEGKATTDDNGEMVNAAAPHLIPRLAFVFCRCQVDQDA